MAVGCQLGPYLFGSRWVFGGMRRRFTVRSIYGRGARRQGQVDVMLLTWLPLTLSNTTSLRITSCVRVWGALLLSLLRLFLLSYSGGLRPHSAHGQSPHWAMQLVTPPRTTGFRLLSGVPKCFCYRCGSGLWCEWLPFGRAQWLPLGRIHRMELRG